MQVCKSSARQDAAGRVECRVWSAQLDHIVECMAGMWAQSVCQAFDAVEALLPTTFALQWHWNNSLHIHKLQRQASMPVLQE